MSKGLHNISECQVGDSLVLTGYNEQKSNYRLKLLAMGLVPGTTFTLSKRAPMGDPIELTFRGSAISLRVEEAKILQLQKEAAHEDCTCGNA